LVISRSSFTILDQIYTQQTRNHDQETRILIYGADESGVRLLQWLTQDTSQQLKPVGFLDSDPYKQKRQVLGVPVIGSIQDLNAILSSLKIEGILLSTEDALNSLQKQELRQICQIHGIWLKKSKIKFEFVE